MFKKTNIAIIAVMVFLFSAGLLPAKTQAITADDIRIQIAALQAQIAELQRQLAIIEKPKEWCHNFNVNLGVGSKGADVEALIVVLEKEGVLSGIMDSDLSDVQKVFSEVIASAVVEFQEKYASEILTPLGLRRGTGYVGKSTRAKLNKIYGCGVIPPKCIQEGGTVAGAGNAGICCGSKMTLIEQITLSRDNQCIRYSGTADVPMVCTYCGNGVCGKGENVCNCPQDCKQIACTLEAKLCPDGSYVSRVAPTCEFAPCPTETCKKEGEVIPFVGDNYRCCSGLRAVTNASGPCPQDSLCEMSAFVCVYCGNGTCGKGENSFNCPQDCKQIACTLEAKLCPDGSYVSRTGPNCEFAECPTAKCIPEGGKGLGANNDSCCEGLTKISNSWGNGDICAVLTNTSFVCSFCGNGICGVGENQCNCPSDCKKTENLPPVIDGLTAPTQLKVREQGTWVVKAHDPENGYLTYGVTWGDELWGPVPLPSLPMSLKEGVQSTTFTHIYSRAGTYTITFTVTDNGYKSAKTSTTVKVVEKVDFYGCYRTDNGDLYKKGEACVYQVSSNAKICSGEDFCSGNKLSQSECVSDAGYQQKWYDCLYGCENGACKKELAGMITVVSPNGGETWTKGTTQTIKWQDNTPIPLCPAGAFCVPPAPKYYDITLVPYYPPCTGTVCSMYYPAPYTIVKNIQGSSYNWSVGKYLEVYGTGTGGIAPDGSYTIQICQTNSTICDSSNNYFKIVSGTVQESITVLSPSGGETWKKGGTYEVKILCSQGISKLLNIVLYNAPYTSDRPLLTGVTCRIGETSAYNVTIPDDPSILVGEQYKIRVDTIDYSIRVLSDNYFSIVAAPTACTDSDGGKNYYTKGSANDAAGTQRTDVCQIDMSTNTNTGVLFEAFCDEVSSANPIVNYVSYTCPYGCQDGVCLQELATSTPATTGTTTSALNIVLKLVAPQISSGNIDVLAEQLASIADNISQFDLKLRQLLGR